MLPCRHHINPARLAIWAGWPPKKEITGSPNFLGAQATFIELLNFLAALATIIEVLIVEEDGLTATNTRRIFIFFVFFMVGVRRLSGLGLQRRLTG